MAGAIGVEDGLACGGFVRPGQFLVAVDAGLARGDQAHMETARNMTGENIGAAAGENHAAELRELDDGLGDLVLQFPEGGMETDEFADQALCLGAAVLRQIRGETFGQMMLGQGFRDEVFVEEHPAAAFFPAKFIQQGHEVLAVSDALHAVALLNEQTHGVDLVLLDLKMPRLGGMTLMETFANWPGARPRFIVMSGEPEYSTFKNHPLVVACLHKPFSFSQLQTQLEKINAEAVAH